MKETFFKNKFGMITCEEHSGVSSVKISASRAEAERKDLAKYSTSTLICELCRQKESNDKKIAEELSQLTKEMVVLNSKK